MDGTGDLGGIVKKGGSIDDLLDDTGKFVDDMLEDNYQKYVRRNQKKGKEIRNRMDWKKRVITGQKNLQWLEVINIIQL